MSEGKDTAWYSPYDQKVDKTNKNILRSPLNVGDLFMLYLVG